MNGFFDAFFGEIEMNVGVATELGSEKVAITWDSLEPLAKHYLRHPTTIKWGCIDKVHTEVQCSNCGFHHFVDIDRAKFSPQRRCSKGKNRKINVGSSERSSLHVFTGKIPADKSLQKSCLTGLFWGSKIRRILITKLFQSFFLPTKSSFV